MQLLIVRHAIAEDGRPGLADAERRLTPRGREKFEQAAQGLARLLPRPDHLFTSPLPRAAETARILADAFGELRPVVLPALADGDKKGLEAALRQCAPDSLVALVGHEPSVSQWTATILGAGSGSACPFKKGGCALLELPSPKLERGHLLLFLSSGALRSVS